MKQTLFMETTSITPEKTIGEISGLLVQAGAKQIAQDFDTAGNIQAVRFVLAVGANEWCYELPARVEPVFKLLNGRRKSSYDRCNKAAQDRDQARRVAWRQLYRWTQAQIALIQCGMAEASEVFLPYMQLAPGVSVYGRFLDGGLKALPAPDTRNEDV